MLAYDTEATIEQAADLHGQAERDNLFIKIPGTPEGLPAIEESIFAGVPINVTLLLSTEQYAGRRRGLHEGDRAPDRGRPRPERRPRSLSLFISRWDVAVARRGPGRAQEHPRGRGRQADLRGLPRAARLATAGRAWPSKGARPQRLLFASTGTKDPDASDTLYVEAFAAPDTINTMPDKTLLAFADHGEVGDPLPADGGDAERGVRGASRRRRRHRRARPPASRRRAPRPSSSPGTTCSGRSSPSRSASSLAG